MLFYRPTKAIPMRPSTILIPLGILAASCTSPANEADTSPVMQEAEAKITEVSTLLVERGNFKREILSQGVLHARSRVEISSDLNEVVTELYIRNGQRVQKGELLAKIDDSKIHSELEQLKLSMQKILRERDKLLIAKLGYGFSTGDSARIPKEVLDMVQMDVGFQEKELEIRVKEAEMKNYVLRAPLAGRIADMHVELLNPPPDNPLFIIIDDRDMLVSFPIMESHFGEIALGDRVRITALASDENHYGKITAINPKVSEGGMIEVRASLSNPNGQLIDGMKCKVAVEKILPGKLVIPKSALVMRDNRKVMFYYEDGLAQWQYIATPYENTDSYVVTTEEGDELPAGKEVIISGNMNLAHESKVVKTGE